MNIPPWRAPGRSLANIPLKRLIQFLIGVSLLLLLLVQLFYYYQFYSLTSSRARGYAEDLLRQVSGQLELYADNVAAGAEKIAFNQHVQEFLLTQDMNRKYVELGPFVQNYLEYVTSSNQNIQDTILLNAQGKILTSVMPYEVDFIETLQESFDFSDGELLTPFFTPAMLSHGSWYQAYIMPIISVSSAGYMFERIGYCVIVSKTDLMKKLVLDISLAPNSHFFVADAAGRILASNMRSDIGQFYEQARYQRGGGRDMIVQEQRIEKAQLTIHSYFSAWDLTNDMVPILRTGVLIAVLSVLLLLSVSQIFLSCVMGSVTRLVDFLRSMQSMEGIHRRVQIEGRNEIGLIARNVNRMLDQIDVMTHTVVETQAKLYDAELNKKQMELHMLQSQINPHFLYNTLNCMVGIGLVYKAPEIVTIATAMSFIFRYSIKGPDLVSAEQEIACVSEYLKIMTIRYHEKFSYTIQVDEALHALKIPKMLMQPIAENALYHGIEQKRGKGLLTLTGAVADGDAVFIIHDDGKGMTGEQLHALRRRLEAEQIGEPAAQIGEPAAQIGEPAAQIGEPAAKSIGLLNIHSRLRLLYGAGYGLSVESGPDQGTAVTLRLPFREERLKPHET